MKQSSGPFVLTLRLMPHCEKKARVCSLLQLCGFWGSNVDHRAWWHESFFKAYLQTPLSTELLGLYNLTMDEDWGTSGFQDLNRLQPVPKYTQEFHGRTKVHPQTR